MQRALRRGLLVLTVALGAACEPPPITGVGPAPSVGIVVSGGANIARGASSQVTVTVSRLSGFTGSIDVSVEGLPAGVTAAFAPATVPASATTSTLTLSASTGATLGTATATLRASAGGVAGATTDLAITVSP